MDDTRFASEEETLNGIGDRAWALDLGEAGSVDILARAEDREQETLIRLRALSGLARHARRGDREALASLRQSLRAKDRAVRAIAVYEYLQAEKHLGRSTKHPRLPCVACSPSRTGGCSIWAPAEPHFARCTVAVG